MIRSIRERIALKIAPWLLTEAEIHQELQPLADQVYGPRIIWTSRYALIQTALRGFKRFYGQANL